LLTANLDGSEETILQIATYATTEFPKFVAWSPDGKRITYSVYTLGDALSTVKTFDVASKQVEPLTSFKSELVSQIVWLPGGQWLLGRYEVKGPSYLRPQIGLIARTGGPIQPVTRDTNSYETLTLSADGKTAATVQVRITRSLSLLPGSGSQGNAPAESLAQAGMSILSPGQPMANCSFPTDKPSGG